MAHKFNATKEARTKAITALVQRFEKDSDRLKDDIANCWEPLLELVEAGGPTSKYITAAIVKKVFVPSRRLSSLLRDLVKDLRFIWRKSWFLLGDRLKAYYSNPDLFDSYAELAKYFERFDKAVERTLKDRKTIVRPKAKAPNRPLRLEESGPSFRVTASFGAPFADSETNFDDDPLEDQSDPFEASSSGSFKRLGRRKKLLVENVGDLRRKALKGNFLRNIRDVQRYPMFMVEAQIDAMRTVHSATPDTSMDKKILREAIITAQWLRERFLQALDGAVPRNDLEKYLKDNKKSKKSGTFSIFKKSKKSGR